MFLLILLALCLGDPVEGIPIFAEGNDQSTFGILTELAHTKFKSPLDCQFRIAEVPDNNIEWQNLLNLANKTAESLGERLISYKTATPNGNLVQQNPDNHDWSIPMDTTEDYLRNTMMKYDNLYLNGVEGVKEYRKAQLPKYGLTKSRIEKALKTESEFMPFFEREIRLKKNRYCLTEMAIKLNQMELTSVKIILLGVSYHPIVAPIMEKVYEMKKMRTNAKKTIRYFDTQILHMESALNANASSADLYGIFTGKDGKPAMFQISSQKTKYTKTPLEYMKDVATVKRFHINSPVAEQAEPIHSPAIVEQRVVKSPATVEEHHQRLNSPATDEGNNFTPAGVEEKRVDSPAPATVREGERDNSLATEGAAQRVDSKGSSLVDSAPATVANEGDERINSPPSEKSPATHGARPRVFVTSQEEFKLVESGKDSRHGGGMITLELAIKRGNKSPATVAESLLSPGELSPLADVDCSGLRQWLKMECELMGGLK